MSQILKILLTYARIVERKKLLCYIFSVGDKMTNSNENLYIDDFLNAVSSTLESKYILIDRKISDMLISIAKCEPVYNVIAKCMINYDFKEAWKNAVKSNFIKLPISDNDRIAFLFCFLSNIDDKNLDITMVLDKYFSYDSEVKPFELFCQNIVVEFKRLILSKLNVKTEPEVNFVENPRYIDEYLLLEQLLNDFLQIVMVQRKIKHLYVKKEEFVSMIQTFIQAVKEKNVAYFQTFSMMINTSVSKNKELKNKFLQIDNLVKDIVGR